MTKRVKEAVTAWKCAITFVRTFPSSPPVTSAVPQTAERRRHLQQPCSSVTPWRSGLPAWKREHISMGGRRAADRTGVGRCLSKILKTFHTCCIICVQALLHLPTVRQNCRSGQFYFSWTLTALCNKLYFSCQTEIQRKFFTCCPWVFIINEVLSPPLW